MSAAPRRLSIIALLAAALASLGLLAAALAGLALWGVGGGTQALDQTARAAAHLERARSAEAAFYRYLLAEASRRLADSPESGETPEAARLRGALRDYRQAVQARIAQMNPDDIDAMRRSLIRAGALASLFEAIETEAMMERALQPRGDPLARAQRFVAVIASERDQTFRSVISQTVAAERASMAEAEARIQQVGERVRRGALLLTGLFMAAAVLVGFIGYRLTIRPIRALTLAAERFRQGDYAARAPDRLPGEFAALGARFNAMAAEIGDSQQRLQEEVAARTAELRAANAELKQVDETRRRFLANVSHELRTPVTVMLGEAQIALRQKNADAAPLREALARIDGSGGYLRRRLDDLMALARSDDGALTLSPAEADAAEAVRAAVESARAYARSREVDLRFEAAGPVPVWADAQALRQAVLALIDNAIKFSPPGGAVTASARPEGDAAVIEVADQGPGFGALDPDRLFDRYAQGDAPAGGTGLGLAVVKWIAESGGGRVSAANREGGGAVIRLTAPRRAEETG